MRLTFPVNQIFSTIQGEARFTGTPSTFLRLQGCSVGCAWCDTKHTWKMTNEWIGIHPDVFLREKSTLENDSFCEFSIDTLKDTLHTYRQNHIVITGGEPCDYDLDDLTSELEMLGYSVQIETSGTSEIRCSDRTWVTLSPKINMAGGKKVRLDAIARANEIKFPVGKMKDIRLLEVEILPHLTQMQQVWLQPLSQNKTATDLCIEQCLKHGYKLSLQTHKFAGIP